MSLLTGLVGVTLSFWYNYSHLHLNTAQQVSVLALVCLGGSYGISFLGSLVVNTFRVPWLLDAESGQQIDALESRAQIAEQAAAEKQKSKEMNALFADLMTRGGTLTQRVTSDGVPDLEITEWVETVINTLVKVELSTDSVAFRHAAEKAEPIIGVIDARSEREKRRRKLVCYRDKLEEIVKLRSL
ncbi:MAG TPA: hypothetical protein VFA74_09195 [Terriglobales bacterium]|nr:hypothetical protein [Terriglobales bacterium]